MKLRFCESQIEGFEKAYVDDQIKNYPNKRELEERLIALQSTVQEQGCMNLCQLKILAEWKSPRILHHIDRNCPDFVEMITGQAFDAKPAWAKLMTLTALHGVREKVASAILHLFGHRRLSHNGQKRRVERWF